MTDRTFRERREKVEFREALREFAEMQDDDFDLSQYEASVAAELSRQYWRDEDRILDAIGNEDYHEFRRVLFGILFGTGGQTWTGQHVPN